MRMIDWVGAIVIALVLVAPTVADAGQRPCYGKAEQHLAKQLHETVPGLSHKLNADRKAVRQLRAQTCGTSRPGRQIGNVAGFYDDKGWNALIVAAETRGLDALPVLAAFYDQANKHK